MASSVFIDELTIFPGLAGGSFGAPLLITLSFDPGIDLISGGFNGDGSGDPYVPGLSCSGEGAVLFADGAGSLVDGPSLSLPGGFLRARGRHGALVPDGDLNLLVATDELERSGLLHVFGKVGAGGFSPDPLGPLDIDDVSSALVDVDGDGVEDLLRAQPDDKSSLQTTTTWSPFERG